MDPRDGQAGALRRELRSQLGRLGVPLQILAEDVAGEADGRIEWIAMAPDGRVCVALVDAEGEDDALVARGLAQRAWVQARIADWLKLAPGLQARPDLRPRLLLLAPEFSRLARVAAREADSDGLLQLARIRWSVGGNGGPALRVELLDPLPSNEPTAAAPAGDRPVASVFRSGLGERDFGANGGS